MSKKQRKPMATAVVNGRYVVHRITGIQRYAHEIAGRLQEELEICAPSSAKGAAGHLWEQTILPMKCQGRLLWSPNASGPLWYGRHVVTFHDLFPIEHPECYGAAYAKFYNFAMPRLARNATHLIAVSEYTKSRIVELLGRAPEDISVIYNGCQMQGPADEKQIGEARTALNLPSRRYVLSLSSLEKRKNLGAILQAWAQIHHLVSEDTWLILAGPSVEESVYGKQDLGAGLPRVLFTGYVPDEHLAGLYTGASLFVFPSLAEGFGLPLLEAMACGVRCITSRNSSLPEVGGDVVTYIDPSDAGELAQAMLRQLGENPGRCDPFAPAIERARRFTWEAAAGKTREVLSAAQFARHPLARRGAERSAAL